MASNDKNFQAPKSKNFGPLKRLLPYLFRHKTQLSLALLFLVLAGSLTLVLPRLIGSLVDQGLGGGLSELSQHYHLLYFLAAALAAASSCRYFFVMWLGERVVADVRADVFSHLTALDMSFYDKAMSGELISRLSADTTQIKSAFGATASLALRNSILCIGAIFMMIWSSPSLSAYALIVIPALLAPLIIIGRLVRKRSRFAQDSLADATAYATEAIATIKTYQAFANERTAADRFSQATMAAFDAAKNSLLIRSILSGLAIFVIFSSITGILWLGAQRVGAGEMAAGTLTSFVIYAVIAAGSLASLSEVWGELQLAAGAAERLSELLNTEAQIKPPLKPAILPQIGKGNAVKFDQVTFSYSGSENPILQNVDFEVSFGETVAIVGASGSGKSTLFNLLLRFYDPQSGSIMLGDTPIHTLEPAQLRKSIAYVSQEPAIFAQSIAQNIAFGRPDASLEEIIAAAEAANATEFISSQSTGFDTQIGERGVTLSGGQRQRLSIARAILKDAPILLLDEATSALDAQSEHMVQDALEKLMQGRTTLVVAHRLATIIDADRILVMDKGKIVETGTHEGLITQGGVYAKLAKLQFEKGAEALRKA